jgi:rare lipoprotein A
VNISRIHIVISLAAAFCLQSCASVPRFTTKDERHRTDKQGTQSQQKEDENPRSIKENENLDQYQDSAVLESAEGIASFYAAKYNGKSTYEGEPYDMNQISAAHPTYQMGTIVRVTNLSNNKSLIMRINDRMPPRPDRIIDLSLGAAKQLDVVRNGTTKVKVDVLQWGTGKK